MDVKAIVATAAEYGKKILSSDILMDALVKAEAASKDVPKAGNQLQKIFGLAELVVEYANGNYTDVPTKTIGAAALAIVYFVSPIDLIPDFIPVIGKVDDALIAGLCWNMVDGDLKKFKDWQKARNTDSTNA